MPDAESAAQHADHQLWSLMEAQRRKLAEQVVINERLQQMHTEPIGLTTEQDGGWGG